MVALSQERARQCHVRDLRVSLRNSQEDFSLTGQGKLPQVWGHFVCQIGGRQEAREEGSRGRREEGQRSSDRWLEQRRLNASSRTTSAEATAMCLLPSNGTQEHDGSVQDMHLRGPRRYVQSTKMKGEGSRSLFRLLWYIF